MVNDEYQYINIHIFVENSSKSLSKALPQLMSRFHRYIQIQNLRDVCFKIPFRYKHTHDDILSVTKPNSPVACGCGIYRLHLCREVRVRYSSRPNEYPGYDTKQSDGEAQVMLELWGMKSTPSLPLFTGPL